MNNFLKFFGPVSLLVVTINLTFLFFASQKGYLYPPGDFYYQYAPFYVAFSERLKDLTSYGYDLSIGLGADFSTTFFYYTKYNIFAYIISIFDLNLYNVSELLFFTKTLVSALTSSLFIYYLAKNQSFYIKASLVIMYVYSPIFYYSYMNIEVISSVYAIMPLYFFSILYFFRKRSMYSFLLLIGSILITLFTNFIFFFIVGSFGLLFLITISLMGSERRHFFTLKIFSLYVLAHILALCLSGFYVFPAVYDVLTSNRNNLEHSFSFFSSNWKYSLLEYKSFMYLPLWIALLLMLFQTNKRAFSFYMISLILLIFFAPLDLIFNLFSVNERRWDFGAFAYILFLVVYLIGKNKVMHSTPWVVSSLLVIFLSAIAYTSQASNWINIIFFVSSFFFISAIILSRKSFSLGYLFLSLIIVTSGLYIGLNNTQFVSENMLNDVVTRNQVFKELDDGLGRIQYSNHSLKSNESIFGHFPSNMAYVSLQNSNTIQHYDSIGTMQLKLLDHQINDMNYKEERLLNFYNIRNIVTTNNRAIVPPTNSSKQQDKGYTVYRRESSDTGYFWGRSIITPSNHDRLSNRLDMMGVVDHETETISHTVIERKSGDYLVKVPEVNTNDNQLFYLNTKNIKNCYPMNSMFSVLNISSNKMTYGEMVTRNCGTKYVVTQPEILLPITHNQLILKFDQYASSEFIDDFLNNLQFKKVNIQELQGTIVKGKIEDDTISLSNVQHPFILTSIAYNKGWTSTTNDVKVFNHNGMIAIDNKEMLSEIDLSYVKPFSILSKRVSILTALLLLFGVSIMRYKINRLNLNYEKSPR